MFKTILFASLLHPLIALNPLPNATTLNNFVAHPAFHAHSRSIHHQYYYKNLTPFGLSPSTIRGVYNLPQSGGTGTIAIVDVYHDPYIQSDLSVFDQTYNLPSCTISNGCLSVHAMSNKISIDANWALETSLDVEWAHAIAPGSKILLVDAKSPSGLDLLNAIDYARRQPKVTAVSMSWGGAEFSTEANYDNFFTSLNGSQIGFYAASGDNGAGVEWPSVSANITGVGGTSLSFLNGSFNLETAWSGSGGGVSNYISEPTYQSNYGITDANARAVPDVAFDADPASGVSVYDSLPYFGQAGWWQVGGTSLGAPAWSAIKALGSGSNAAYYKDAISNPSSFRDITAGANGSCSLLCSTGPGYDMVTGLGSPLIHNY